MSINIKLLKQIKSEILGSLGIAVVLGRNCYAIPP